MAADSKLKEEASSLRQRGKKVSTEAVDKTSPEDKPKPRYKKRKQLPSVSDLLAYGPEETRGQPKTWGEIFCLPVALAILFAISLLIFHYAAPHHLSEKRSFQLPKVVQSIQERRMERLRERWMQENSNSYHKQHGEEEKL